MPITCKDKFGFDAPVRGMEYEVDFLWDYIEKLSKYIEISEVRRGHYNARIMIQKYAEKTLGCSLAYDLDDDGAFDFDKLHNFNYNLDRVKEEHKKLEGQASEWEDEVEKLKEEKYSLYAKWQERGEEIKELKEKVKGVVELHNLAVNMANDDNARLQEEIKELKEKVEIQEVDDTVLYPTDTGEIIDPESRDVYTFGNSCKSSIEENCKMSRIIRNGHKKGCVQANAFCMIIIDGKLYYVGRSGSGPVHVRTIKGEKTTITSQDLGSRWKY